jgi:hypothetical protein
MILCIQILVEDNNGIILFDTTRILHGLDFSLIYLCYILPRLIHLFLRFTICAIRIIINYNTICILYTLQNI